MLPNILCYKGLIQSKMSVALMVRNAMLPFGSTDLTCTQSTCRDCAVNWVELEVSPLTSGSQK